MTCMMNTSINNTALPHRNAVDFHACLNITTTGSNLNSTTGGATTNSSTTTTTDTSARRTTCVIIDATFSEITPISGDGSTAFLSLEKIFELNSNFLLNKARGSLLDAVEHATCEYTPQGQPDFVLKIVHI
jgi:hypothetical protein